MEMKILLYSFLFLFIVILAVFHIARGSPHENDCKESLQNPQSRKKSVKGWEGVPPFSVNIFPLGFWEPTVR